MENSSGKWILVETFFQNEGILVEIFKGCILVDIFHEFSWTKMSTKIHPIKGILVDNVWVNSRGNWKKCPREYTQTLSTRIHWGEVKGYT